MNLKLEKILLDENILKSINENVEYLLELIPELKDTIGFEHNHPHHHLDVWSHTLLAISLSEQNFEIRLSLLLHDIGKPHCYQEGEVRHFRGHSKESSKISKNILKRLCYNDEFIQEVCYLIEKHDIPIRREEIIDNYDLEYKRYKIQYCDALAHHPNKLEKRKQYLQKMENIFNELRKENLCLIKKNV